MLGVRSLAVIALTVALVAVGSAPASANHSWNNYHWGRTANPFTLQLGDNVSNSWDAHLTAASVDWSVSSVLDTAIVSGGTTGPDCQPSEGRVEVCNATYGSNGWLGLAQIWLSGSHIFQGTAKVNDTYFNTAKYNDLNAKRHVLCQEVGHTFGLGHQKKLQAQSCMNDRFGLFSAAYVSPNAHDYEQLVLIYNHTDSATSSPGRSGAAPAPGFQEDGTPFGASRARGDVYVTDLGGGRQIVTFITWAR